MIKFIYTLLACLIVSSTVVQASVTEQRRSVQTCADPTLAEVYIAAYNAIDTEHIVTPRALVVLQRNAGADWELQGGVFRAWQTPQDFTFPLYRLFNPTITDWITVLSTTGTAPVVSGYENAMIIGYAYSTQVCGSVPLLGAFMQSQGDHWYTADASEHATFVANGWVDSGTVGFVLPLTDCGCSESS